MTAEQAADLLPTVAVVGMGYVGLTLASLLASRGYRVHGVEVNPKAVDSLNNRTLHLVEPGVEEAVRDCIGKNWTVGPAYAFAPDVAIICVSTPVGADHQPNLTNLRQASAALAAVVRDDALVIVRSTVPVGTTRRIVLPLFAGTRVRVAFCPERTIHGQALRELQELPQVVGGLDQASTEAAASFFDPFVRRVMKVSSLEAAEIVKLANNCHTDVIYSYGNEVALMAQAFGLDPLEVIEAANIDHPRPDLARPGFVGGASFTKDSHILFASFGNDPAQATLIRSARTLNERMPGEVARHLRRAIEASGRRIADATILVCGFAYRGVPETDDMRGSPLGPFLEALGADHRATLGHDFVVSAEVIRSYGATPVALDDGFRQADAVIFLNNHPRYAALDMGALLATARRPLVFYDCWRIFRRHPALPATGVHYAGIGYEAK
jgi:UDP-N-acetyl-D-mannosaminuronic acid dehydrogenase